MNIEIFYQPNFPEYFRVVRHIAVKRFRRFLIILLLMPLALILFTVMEQRTGGPTPFLAKELWGALLIPAGLVLLMYLSIYNSARKQWARAPEIREPRKMTITEKGFDARGETFSGTSEWVNIAGGERYGDLCLLRTRQGLYYLVPKRSFSGDDELQEFFSFVRGKLGRSFRG